MLEFVLDKNDCRCLLSYRKPSQLGKYPWSKLIHEQLVRESKSKLQAGRQASNNQFSNYKVNKVNSFKKAVTAVAEECYPPLPLPRSN